MKKLFMGLSLILCLLLSFSSFAFAYNDNMPKEVIKGAQEGLKLFKDRVGEDPEKFGFDSIKDVKKVELGKGFNLQFINKNKLKTSTNDSVLDVCDETKFWRFILNLNGKAKTFLTIGYKDGEYKLVHFGGNAQTFQETLLKYEELSKGNAPKVVTFRNYHLMINKTENKEEVLLSIPKEKSQYLSGLSNQDFVDSKVIKEMLKEDIEEDKAGGGTSQGSTQDNSNLSFFLGVSLILLVGLFLVIKIRRKEHAEE